MKTTRPTIPHPRRLALRAATILGLAGLLAAPMAWAQKYPDKPIRLIVGYSAGGGVDAVARLLSARLPAVLGQQVLVENRTGATGLIAADFVAKAPADGYTLMMGDSALLIAKLLQPKIAIDPLTSFKPVAGAFVSPLMIVTGNDFPRRRQRNSSPSSRRTRAASPSRPRAWARCSTWASRCSSSPPAVSWCMCRTAAPRRSCPT